MKKKFKALIAGVMAVATIAATAIAASAYSINSSNNTTGHNWLETKTSFRQTNGWDKVPEFTRSYMDAEIAKDGDVDLKLDHYSKPGWILASFEPSITSITEAFNYARKLDIIDYFNDTVIFELRYDYVGNSKAGAKRFYLVSLGGFKTEFKGDGQKLLKKLTDSIYWADPADYNSVADMRFKYSYDSKWGYVDLAKYSLHIQSVPSNIKEFANVFNNSRCYPQLHIISNSGRDVIPQTKKTSQAGADTIGTSYTLNHVTSPKSYTTYTNTIKFQITTKSGTFTDKITTVQTTDGSLKTYPPVETEYTKTKIVANDYTAELKGNTIYIVVKKNNYTKAYWDYDMTNTSQAKRVYEAVGIKAACEYAGMTSVADYINIKWEGVTSSNTIAI